MMFPSVQLKDERSWILHIRREMQYISSIQDGLVTFLGAQTLVQWFNNLSGVANNNWLVQTTLFFDLRFVLCINCLMYKLSFTILEPHQLFCLPWFFTLSLAFG